MKNCPYCGRENAGDARCCRECGTDFPPAKSPSKVGFNLGLGGIPTAFGVQDGFSRPQWPEIFSALRAYHTPDERLGAWAEIASQWARRWQVELGDGFNLANSGCLQLVSPLDNEAAVEFLLQSNERVERIKHHLGPIAWQDRPQIVVVHIPDEALATRFDQAVAPPAPTSQAGERALARSLQWVLLGGTELKLMAHDLKQELAWNCLAHLPLPYWTKVGVSAWLWPRLESATRGATGEPFDADLIPEHRRHWDATTIQNFWGGAWPASAEEGVLYNELARILVQLLIEKAGAHLTDFLRCAHGYDAGQSAALSCAQTDLGALAGTFLGPGHWAPDDVVIAAHWDELRP